MAKIVNNVTATLPQSGTCLPKSSGKIARSGFSLYPLAKKGLMLRLPEKHLPSQTINNGGVKFLKLRDEEVVVLETGTQNTLLYCVTVHHEN